MAAAGNDPMQPVRALVRAYKQGEESGGSVEWEELDDVYADARRVLTAIRRRPIPGNAPEHERTAVAACQLLVDAYARGRRSGGSIDWEDLDLAHERALEAISQECNHQRRSSPRRPR